MKNIKYQYDERFLIPLLLLPVCSHGSHDTLLLSLTVPYSIACLFTSRHCYFSEVRCVRCCLLRCPNDHNAGREQGKRR
ncbi:uncharacterized protein SCHCODRAFT_02070558 [Schizophyllum commune H4-8]|uniref:uncharacterized protein n=1 Tax=Schizophyllum commune (strain H4-8 / FGSC 9210) TaxID=578458 RepID=UPI00215F9A6B|nr:uncharacterized protein SCHCODRAFT_02070558 [Schizophyllum commune H4-8]KAI5887694.1 hypothetical protein SCHCODRAFT_02070558 [Schizophyllum commune H4-8]